MDTTPFERALRRIPAIGIGTVMGGRTEVAGLGSIADHPNPGSLTWEIGSITKVFTGILLADMAIRGEVDLDDPIGRHAPAEVGNRLPPDDDQPTLRDLATHTAGLPRVPYVWLRRIRNDPNPYARLTEQDVWDVLTGSTRRPTRPRVRYSNYGMGLLGHLLARAGARSYADLVRDRILDPLGMMSTGVGLGDPVPGFRKSKPTPPWTFGAVEGAGGLRSTLDDILRFMSAVLAPPDPEWERRMALARQVHHEGRFVSMGLGWQIRREPRSARRDTVWHNGGTYGGSAFLSIDVSRATALAAFGNRGPRVAPPLDRAGWKAFDELSRRPSPESR